MDTIKEFKDILESKINDSDEVFITPHNGPDFDAIGSAIGMNEICNNFKKESFIIVNEALSILQPGVRKIIDETQSKYQYINLEGFDKFKNRNSNKLLVAVDTNKSYLIPISKELEHFKNVLIIDHHRTDESTIPASNMFIDPLISSTSEIMFNLIKYYNVKIDSYTAAYLLAGIMVDTARYTRNVSDKTFEIISKLTKIMCKDLSADYANSIFMDSFESDRIVQDIIKNTIFRTIETAIATDRDNPNKIYTKEDFAKAADYLLRYNVSASFALGYIDKETISISARSNGGANGIDVGEIMKQFGGGGNSMSAAAKITCTNESILDIEDKLQKILKPGSH